jgi:hypothetical protein
MVLWQCDTLKYRAVFQLDRSHFWGRSVVLLMFTWRATTGLQAMHLEEEAIMYASDLSRRL